MKKILEQSRYLLIFAMCLLVGNPQLAHCETAKLNIVTTTMEAADFVRQVGGRFVSVHSIYDGMHDMHFFKPRPSEVIRMGRADALVVYGIAHDKWVAAMVNAARNPNISFGARGYIDMSDGIHAKNVPPGGRVDLRKGHVHPYGACGYLLCPKNVRIAVENIYKGLVRLDPKNADYYRRNKEAYLAKVDETFRRLKQKMAEFERAKVVTYHESWLYFIDTFNLNFVGALEPKPGLPPTPGHLSELISTMRKENVRLVMAEPYYPRRPVRFVTEQTGARGVTVASFVGGIRNRTTFLDNLEYTVERIIEALRS